MIYELQPLEKGVVRITISHVYHKLLITFKSEKRKKYCGGWEQEDRHHQKDRQTERQKETHTPREDSHTEQLFLLIWAIIVRGILILIAWWRIELLRKFEFCWVSYHFPESFYPIVFLRVHIHFNCSFNFSETSI